MIKSRLRNIPDGTRPIIVTVLFLIVLLGVPDLSAQLPGAYQDTLISLAPGDSLLRLSHEFLIRGTVILSADSVVLRPERDYAIDSRRGRIRLLPHVRSGPDSTTAIYSGSFRVRYRYYPLSFRSEYRKREALLQPDTVRGTVDTVYAPLPSFSPEELFGPDLRKSGSLVRGVRVGTNRDLTLNSGFRLQMAGRLSDDLDILAALTDENSPIQPEGTTQTLQEIDRVFIELRSKNAAVTVGDLTLDFRSGEFGRLRRKLRGALGSYTISGPADSTIIDAGGASVRGKFTTNDFRGIQGVRGPYRLRGRENEYPIIVIAGTERVYIDGRELTRGELNDYVIDYSLGEVIFTSRRRITFASRIVVEFEYTDRRYARNLLGGKSEVSLGSGRWRIGTMLLQESDDRDALTDYQLSDEDRAILRDAGDSRTLASRSGVEYAGPGKGRYALRDTTVFIPELGAYSDTVVLVYSPADTVNGVYNVTFSYVGAGGDYEKVSVGQYRYAGPGRGNYAPVRFLPLPEKHSFASFDLEGRITDEVSLTGEYALSDFDRNTFSQVGDDDNTGGAYNLGLAYHPKDPSVAGIGLSSVGLTVRERRIDAAFVPLERFKEVEFSRNWNISGEGPDPELLREAGLSVGSAESFSFGGTAGWIRRGERFSANRYAGSLKFSRNLDYSLWYLESDDSTTGRTTKRITHTGGGRIIFGNIVPSVSVIREYQEESGSSGPGAGSYAFTEISSGVSVDSIHRMQMSAVAGVRFDDSVRNARIGRVSESFFQTFGWRYEGGRTFNSALDLQIQKRKFFNDTIQRPVENTVLVRSRVTFMPFGRGFQTDLFYEASPERAARLERVFTRVARGTGNYSYEGDVNGNGIVDEADFRLTRFDGEYQRLTVPGDAFIPVINLQTSARIKIDLSRLFTPGEHAVGSLLSPFSSETYLRIEEKSTDQRKSNIYLLRVRTFRDPATTLQGSFLILQDLNLFEHNPDFSLRFRYHQRKSLTNLVAGEEAAFYRERGIRFTWSLGWNLSNQIELTEKRDNLVSAETSLRNRGVRGTSLSSEWIYRPVSDIESGFGFTFGDAKNYDIGSASLNDQHVYLSYALKYSGRLRAEFRREEALIRGLPENVPFELTSGKKAGITWIWRLDFEYRLTQFLESSLRYEGRSEGRLPTVHNGSMEVRAFF